MIVDPTRVCELLVGLGEVTVLGADDEPGGPVRVHVETCSDPPVVPLAAVARCGRRTSGPWSWSIWLRSGGRHGWGVAQVRLVVPGGWAGG